MQSRRIPVGPIAVVSFGAALLGAIGLWLGQPAASPRRMAVRAHELGIETPPVALVPCGPTARAGEGLQTQEPVLQPRDEAVRRLAEADPELEVAWGDAEGTIPIAVHGRLSGPDRAGKPREAALGFLEQNRELWGIQVASAELRSEEGQTRTDDLGMTHVRFDQVWNGVPVHGRSLTVHAQPDGSITAVTGSFDPHVRDAGAAAARLDGAEAIAVARKEMSLEGKLSREPHPLLCFHGADLAWRVDLVSVQRGIARRIFVDAVSGKVLANEERRRACTGLTPAGNVVDINCWDPGWLHPYSLKDVDSETMITTHRTTHAISPSDPGETWDESDAIHDWDGYFGGADEISAVAAHRNMGRTLWFWLSELGRHSYDGAGTGVANIVRVDLPMTFTFADDGIFVFGGAAYGERGPSCLDIVSHEFTHAVIAHTCDLHLFGENGAIQEHLCDAFGVLLEMAYGTEPNPGKVIFDGDQVLVEPMMNLPYAAGTWNWTIGEEVQYDGTPYRDFQNPERKHYVQYQENLIDEQANAYANAGILNQFMFLWMQGGTNAVSGIQVDGINKKLFEWWARRDVAKILYRAMNTYLTPASNFQAYRSAILQSCKDLFGQSTHYYAAQWAFKAIGIGDGAVSLLSLMKGGYFVTSNGFYLMPNNYSQYGTVSFAETYYDDFKAKASWIAMMPGIKKPGFPSNIVMVGTRYLKLPSDSVQIAATVGVDYDATSVVRVQFLGGSASAPSAYSSFQTIASDGKPTVIVLPAKQCAGKWGTLEIALVDNTETWTWNNQMERVVWGYLVSQSEAQK